MLWHVPGSTFSDFDIVPILTCSRFASSEFGMASNLLFKSATPLYSNTSFKAVYSKKS